MKTIETKYHGATNHRPSRISAQTQDNPRIMVSYDQELGDTANHAAAAKKLRDQMGWGKSMVGGGTKAGMCWVFIIGSPAIDEGI